MYFFRDVIQKGAAVLINQFLLKFEIVHGLHGPPLLGWPPLVHGLHGQLSRTGSSGDSMASSPGLAPQGTPWPALQGWILRVRHGQLSRAGSSRYAMASSPGLAPPGTTWPALQDRPPSVHEMLHGRPCKQYKMCVDKCLQWSRVVIYCEYL